MEGRRRLRSGFAVVVTALVALLLGSSAAYASSLWGYTDPRGDARPAVDVKQTALDTRLSGYYRVRITGQEFVKDSTDAVRIYFDTRSYDNGPEYRLTWYFGANPGGALTAPGRLYLTRTDTWESDGTSLRCLGIRRAIDYAHDVITISVPRRCLGRPAQVRWAGWVLRLTRVDAQEKIYGYFDYFPRANTFRPQWVG
jgi:hypothetical protein